MSCFNFLLLILFCTSTPFALSLPEPRPALRVAGGWGNNGTEVHWRPGQPAPVNDVVFSWCRTEGGGCDRAALKHGRCYDLGMLDGSIRARLNSVGAQDGRCMLFQHHDCTGEHTAMFAGRGLRAKSLCGKKGKVEWNRQAAAVRCCAGGPGRPWCNVAIRKADRCTQG
ncbi:hypothetical protein J3F83DRAFT_289435 [Trichoderma novae-zelandiae]